MSQSKWNSLALAAEHKKETLNSIDFIRIIDEFASMKPVESNCSISCDFCDYNYNEKSVQRDANTARALAAVRLGHRPPARCHKPTYRTDYNTLHRS